MAKVLYTVGVIALVSTGALCTYCGRQWLHEAPQDPRIAECPSVGQRRGEKRPGERSPQETASPLVRQATAFALYLKPPEPPAPRETPQPQTAAQVVPRPAAATAPKFRLLSTSWHHAHPEMSLALVSEPGRGDHWVRQGDQLGHLVIESIGNGAIIYRDGAQVQQMAVTMRQTVELVRAKSMTSAPALSAAPDMRLVSTPQRNQAGAGMAEGPPVTWQ